MGPQKLWGLLGRHESVSHFIHLPVIVEQCCSLVTVLHFSEPPGESASRARKETEYKADAEIPNTGSPYWRMKCRHSKL
jgi:hypothetical protein